jgi:site-specific DNA-cytosine methylase
MENVPQVHSQDNMPDFRKWLDFLESLGYTNYYQDLNAKNYGVAQNRERCFMFSFLGEYNYHFPQPIPLKKKLKDYLEDNVDEKYYINNEKADKLIRQLIDNGTLPQHNLDRQTDRQTDRQAGRQTDRLALTEQSINRSKEKSQTVSRQNMTAEYQTCGQTETLLLSNQATQIEKQIDIATTLMARDYKGFGNQSMNGVIEWK